MTATLPGLDVPPWSLELDRPVFGIDPSTVRMSVCVLLPAHERKDRAFEVETLSLPRHPDPVRRLGLTLAEFRPWLEARLRHYEPQLVVVEQPFAQAKHVPPASYYVLGVLLAILGAWCVPVQTVSPAEWKSKALGKGFGGVRKPKRSSGGSSGEEYAVLSWARSVGYAGSLWDEADAIGIATAGGVMLGARR